MNKSNSPSITRPPAPPASSPDAGYLRSLSEYIVREFSRRVLTDTVMTQLFLASPDGSVFQIKVSDAGVISATKVSG